jgi:hypothetical protein
MLPMLPALVVLVLLPPGPAGDPVPNRLSEEHSR